MGTFGPCEESGSERGTSLAPLETAPASSAGAVFPGVWPHRSLASFEQPPVLSRTEWEP